MHSNRTCASICILNQALRFAPQICVVSLALCILHSKICVSNLTFSACISKFAFQTLRFASCVSHFLCILRIASNFARLRPVWVHNQLLQRLISIGQGGKHYRRPITNCLRNEGGCEEHDGPLEIDHVRDISVYQAVSIISASAHVGMARKSMVKEM